MSLLESRALVVGTGPLAVRSQRALQAQGLPVTIVADHAALADVARREPVGSAWVVRAGAWPCERLVAPPRSATGLPLVALGALPGEEPVHGLAPETLNDRHGRTWTRRGWLYVDSLDALTRAPKHLRIVALPGAAPAFDPRLRVALVVTTLHRGGAERIVSSLAGQLPQLGISTRLATLTRPVRETYPAPPGTLDLSTAPSTRTRSRADRVRVLGERMAQAGIDLAHLHLLGGDEIRVLAATGIPMVLTLHNARTGWQTGQDQLEAGDLDLIVACARSVAREASQRPRAAPTRTIWNGIDPALSRARDPAAARARFRALHGLPATGWVLLSLANLRAQKRLEQLIFTLAALLERGRDAWLVLAGDLRDPTDAGAARALETAIAKWEVGHRVIRPGVLTDLRDAIAGCDLLVSASRHEGLPLAQLEALAGGLPLVVTDVDGAREIADLHADHVTLVRPDEHDLTGALCDAVVTTLEKTSAPAPRLAKAFTETTMVQRHAHLYRRVLAARSPRETDLVVILNNLVVGGAQSSARRLLETLAEQGTRVRAMVVEERIDRPSPGRSALGARGIAVDLTAPARDVTPDRVLDDALRFLDAARPRNVFFWNLRPILRVRLADALLGVRVVDVSPGAMSFDSLEQLFAAGGYGPLRDAGDYGRLLHSAVVKYTGERERAERLLGCPIHVVANGVAIPAEPRVLDRNATDRFVVGTAARLSPDKKLEQLLAAVRRTAPHLPELQVLIAGGEDPGHEAYAAELRAAARDLPVRFLGDVRDLAAFHAQLSAFVVVSEPEGCPNAALEARAAGLPLIMTDAGGARDQIDDGETGLLVGRADAAALAEALIRLGRDPALAARLGAAGRADMKRRFSLARMAADYRALLAQ